MRTCGSLAEFGRASPAGSGARRIGPSLLERLPRSTALRIPPQPYLPDAAVGSHILSRNPRRRTAQGQNGGSNRDLTTPILRVRSIASAAARVFAKLKPGGLLPSEEEKPWTAEPVELTWPASWSSRLQARREPGGAGDRGVLDHEVLHHLVLDDDRHLGRGDLHPPHSDALGDGAGVALPGGPPRRDIKGGEQAGRVATLVVVRVARTCPGLIGSASRAWSGLWICVFSSTEGTNAHTGEARHRPTMSRPGVSQSLDPR
jgi:hypothetical protein